MRLSPLLVLLGALFLGTACSADATDDDATSDNDLITLKDLAQIDRKVSGSGRVTLAYEPAEYPRDGYGRLPFLGIELATSGGATAANLHPTTNGSAPLTVHVEGKFPGEPQVVITDANFRALGSTRGKATDKGMEANLTVNATPGKKFVLVRDRLWVKPMTFDITIGR